jgi:hypothetical protein
MRNSSEACGTLRLCVRSQELRLKSRGVDLDLDLTIRRFRRRPQMDEKLNLCHPSADTFKYNNQASDLIVRVIVVILFSRAACGFRTPSLLGVFTIEEQLERLRLFICLDNA